MCPNKDQGLISVFCSRSVWTFPDKSRCQPVKTSNCNVHSAVREVEYSPLPQEHKAWQTQARNWRAQELRFLAGRRSLHRRRLWAHTYLSTRVRMTASVSSTSPSTFCFFLLGSCGPRPLLGGRTGSRGWFLVSAVGTALFSACCCWLSTLSSAPLSSRQIQELPMAAVALRVPSKWAMCSSRVNSRPWPRLLLAKNTAQPKTII